MKILDVKLGSRQYPIAIGSGAFDSAVEQLTKLTQSKRKIFCIADVAVLNAHPQKAQAIEQIATIIKVDGGESTKSIAKFGEICSQLAQNKADRKSVIVALGGGVIGDLAGFVAASYMRGVDFYQIPTTLLAMVDSSVGGKTGVNIVEGKNLVGAFHQPKGVFTDIDFLNTLPSRQFAAGMAEVIKCAILGDYEFFEILENMTSPVSLNSEELSLSILKACQLKAKVVADDECETSAQGGRALLNLGHTFGHAIEHCAGYGTYMHGEAVAIGMVMAGVLSVKLGYIDNSQLVKIIDMLKFNNLPVSLEKDISADDLLEAMSRDKKAFAGSLRFVTIKEIGETITENVDKEIVKESISDFFAL